MHRKTTRHISTVLRSRRQTCSGPKGLEPNIWGMGMPPLAPSDFPQEIQNILGTAAKLDDCSYRQPVCMAESRVTAQVFDPQAVLPGHVPPQVLGAYDLESPMHIRNALRGDLIMTPGRAERRMLSEPVAPKPSIIFARYARATLPLNTHQRSQCIPG